MNILIVGCSTVGVSLARMLDDEGHDVAVVDRREQMFDMLPADFSGFTITGVPIDQDVLKRAGIENADAVVAITKEDNVNIMVAQLAKEIFHVPKVLARIFDTSRENVYSHFGLQTVCPTNLTVAALRASLFESESIKNVNMGLNTIMFNKMEIPKEYIGLRASSINFEKNEVLFAVERNGNTILVGLTNIEMKKGDKLIFAKLID